jgi:uncharacterized protein with HEPN domain
MGNSPTTESENLPSTANRFAHIASAICNFQTALHGLSYQEFADDFMRQMAMERWLEIIGITSDHIPADIKAAEATVDWQAIADISNRLENTRDRIEPGILWDMAQEQLIPLKLCAERHKAME